MARRSSKIGKKMAEKRRLFWPELNDDELYNHKNSNGFTSVPRTMPLIMAIIDDLTKGKPAGRAYFELWMRAYGEMYVPIKNKESHAFHAGYSGQRSVQTWTKKIRSLEELGFIKTKDGASGLAHIVIINPHIVLKRLYEANTPGLTEHMYNALLEHSIEFSMTGVNVDPRKLELEIPF